ncbi:MAG TPA: phosphopyruvate hydratase [Pseudonocardiaceae bacterium]
MVNGIRVSGVDAFEILDSRSRPTLQVSVQTADGRTATAGVPAGASTGKLEAVELRDGDQKRYNGQGVLKAVASVTGEIAQLLAGKEWANQAEIDAALIELDGTENKSRLGANAIIGVSMAFARLFAGDTPLWKHLIVPAAVPRLPVPHFNVLNGGAHAANNLDFQEFMIAPIGAPSMAEAVRAGSEVYAALKKLLVSKGHVVGLGDEGGFAPQIDLPEDALDLLVQAIEDAGYVTGLDGVAIAIDPAASQFQQSDGSYLIAGQRHSNEDLVARYVELVRDYPLWSIEDGMAEDDYEGFKLLYAELGEHIQIMGDDVFVTNPKLIAQGASEGWANSSLIKLNQIGTVTETLQALQTCRDNGMTAQISHRSGETPDDFIADLTVACGSGQLKSGAPARGERVAKYNRLIAIARQDPSLPYGLPESALSGIHTG